MPTNSTVERASLDITTAHLKGRDKFEFWQDIARRAIAGCEVSAASPIDFDITANGLIQQDISLLRIQCSPFKVIRNPDRSFDATDDSVLLFFVKSGNILVEQDKRFTVVEAGDSVVVVANRPYNVQIAGAHEAYSVRLPRVLLGRANGFETMTARSLSNATPLGKLLFTFAEGLCEAPALMDAMLVGRLILNFTDLLGTIQEGVSGTGEGTEHTSGTAATLKRVKKFIELNLTDPKLTAGAVADQLKLSPRYLRKLFEREERTLVKYISDQRLDRAAAALTQFSHQPIMAKSIAYTHGFKDPSHFAAAFRERFQETPMQYRKRVWRALGILQEVQGRDSPQPV